MCDDRYPRQILSKDDDVTVNDHGYYLKRAGYDLNDIWYVKLTFMDYEYSKMLYHTKELLDWRDKANDSKHNSNEINVVHNDKSLFLYTCFGNCYYLGHISVGQMIFVGTSRKSGSMELIRDYIKHISSIPNKKPVGDVKRIQLFDPTIGGIVEIMGREISTVYMPSEQKTKIVTDIEKFLSEDTTEFNYKHGIPDKLVYLLYGLPGTGKTSLIKAIATTFNLTITTLKLTNTNDEMLRSFLMSIPRDALILLDDIDSTFKSVSSCSSHIGGHLSFSALLEMLDGMNTPNKKLIFMTCNDTKIFDSPTMRPGRIDRIIKFGPMTSETIIDMLNSFFTEDQTCADRSLTMKTIASQLHGKITPAELQTMILETQNLSALSVKTKTKVEEMRDRYTRLNEHNQSMYQQFYANQYPAYVKQASMYT